MRKHNVQRCRSVHALRPHVSPLMDPASAETHPACQLLRNGKSKPTSAETRASDVGCAGTTAIVDHHVGDEGKVTGRAVDALDPGHQTRRGNDRRVDRRERLPRALGVCVRQGRSVEVATKAALTTALANGQPVRGAA